jgi:hypothetical protein
MIKTHEDIFDQQYLIITDYIAFLYEILKLKKEYISKWGEQAWDEFTTQLLIDSPSEIEKMEEIYKKS